MISGDRSVLSGKKGAFWYTLLEFRKYWERIDVITPHIEDVSVEFAGHNRVDMQDGKSVFFHPCPKGLWHQPRWILKKGKELYENFHHDVMTVHEYPPFYNGIGAKRLSRKTGLPYAIEIHHIIGYPEPASWSERIGLWMSRHYLKHDAKHAKAVRTVNQTVQTKLIEWGVPEEKVSIVPSFYLRKDYLRGTVKPPIAYDVAFCARLVPNKGLKHLIEAAVKLPSLRVLVVGDGPERAASEALVRKYNMGHRFTFAGWLSTQEDVIGAMQSARMFVMVSRSEGGPRIALEAMASGMAVISTPVGVMPDVIQDGFNGLFTTGEPDDLATKITFLLNDEEARARMGYEAQTVLDTFDGPELVRQYANFLWSIT